MWTSLPLPVRLLLAGIVASVLLVVGAVVLRSPPHAALEQDEPPVALSVMGPRPDPSAPARVVSASSASPAPIDPVPVGPPPPPSDAARALRSELHKELQLEHYSVAAGALGRLLDAEPRAAEDAEVRGDVVELSQRVMLLTGDEPDRVFGLITTKMGTTGMDVLYELMTTRGGSRGAARAEELLRDDQVRARGTKALRIAYDLRAAHDCEAKKALFARAASEGDGRTLGQLQLLNRRCGRRAVGCCMQNDPELKQAMDGIKARSN